MYNAAKALVCFKFAGAMMDRGIPQFHASLVAILLTAVAFAYGTFVPIESTWLAPMNRIRLWRREYITAEDHGSGSLKRPQDRSFAAWQLVRFDRHDSASPQERDGNKG